MFLFIYIFNNLIFLLIKELIHWIDETINELILPYIFLISASDNKFSCLADVFDVGLLFWRGTRLL